MKKVRITSVSNKAHLWNDFVIEDILYSGKLALEEADGLLAMVDPTEELLRFKGPKLWLTYEPSWHSHYRRNPIGKKLVKVLAEDEWAYFANPNEKYRVPHSVYIGNLDCHRSDKIENKCIAVVSNYGGRAWFLRPHIWLRNIMIFNQKIDLYGREEIWKKFRHFPRIWTMRPPQNYKGPLRTDSSEQHIRFLSQYKACVCLENSCEKYYFTEKFVNAVRAGCIPIYHAHASVRELFLKGARWVDPKHFWYRPNHTIEYALAQDINEYRQANDAWLKSGILEKLDDAKLIQIWLHPILKEKFEKAEKRRA